MGNEVAIREEGALTAGHDFSVAEVVDRVKKVRQLYKDVMQEGTHYGKVPGTDKPTILQPGIDLLAMMFKLDAEFETDIHRDGDHREIKSHCTVMHIPSGTRVSSAEAICTTRESRYAWRNADRKCPNCGNAAIIKGRPEYGGGWVCFNKKGGCGAKYKDGDPAIESQPVGRVPNPDIADVYNTVLKIANKRSKATGILNATAATEVFTVDMEDFVGTEDLSGTKPESKVDPDPKTGTPEPTGAVSEPKKATPAEKKKAPPKDTPVDTTATPVNEEELIPTAPISAERLAWVEKQVKELKVPETLLFATYKVQALKDLTNAMFDKLSPWCATRRAKLIATGEING